MAEISMLGFPNFFIQFDLEKLNVHVQMANHREVQPKGKQHGARMVNQLIPVNLKNQPISAHLCTMGVVISMSLLHPTKSLELQKL